MSIFQRLWDGFGFGDSDESEYEYEYVEEAPSDQAVWQANASDPQSSSSTNVVGMPARGIGQTEVLVVEPRSFEEIPQVVSALKQRKSVILNLGLLDADAAQRCVDFVAGGAFAIDGHQERIGETIFLFTPGFVHISNYLGTDSQVEPPPTSPATAPQRFAVPTPTWSIENASIAR
jgi:cell division inhibitor SepF